MTQQEPKRILAPDDQIANLVEAFSERENSLFRVLAEITPASIFIWRDTRFYFVNSAMVKNSGYSAQELLGMNFWELVRPDCRDLVKEQGLARARGEPVPSRYETKILGKDGEEHWVDLANSVVDIEGKPAVLGVGFDITERKQAEQKLRQAHDELESQVEERTME